MDRMNPLLQINENLSVSTPKLSYHDGVVLAEWRKAALRKLNELLGMDSFLETDLNLRIEHEKERNDHKEIKFVITTEKYFDMPCYLLLPNEIENPPLMVCLQGHSSGVHISLGKPKFDGDEAIIDSGSDFGIQSVKQGFAALCIEMRYFGERKEHPDEKGPECWIPSMSEIMMGRTAIGGRVWDIMKALDALEQSFSDTVDMTKVAILGHSGGGTASLYAAALEPRIQAVISSCALCSFSKSISVIKHCVCNHIPGILNWFEMGDLAGLIAPKPLVAVAGIKDEIFPIEGIKEAYATVEKWYKLSGAPDACRLVVGDGGHRFFPEQAWGAFL